MQVSDLITLMGTLSVGSDNVTASERAIFLQYLNLAHFQLYQETSAWNDDILVNQTSKNDGGSTTIILEKTPFSMNSVYDITNQNSLKQRSIRDILEEDPYFEATGFPNSFFIQNNILTLYPTQNKSVEVKIWYTPQPTSLKDDSEETDIPYPVAFHPVLVDGALYYLFQQEGGFKNTVKEGEARDRWNNGKSFLLSYFYSRQPNSLSTFSNV
jgi:hypothetical protein